MFKKREACLSLNFNLEAFAYFVNNCNVYIYARSFSRSLYSF